MKRNNFKNILFLIPHLGRCGAERSLSIVSKHMEMDENINNVFVCVFSNTEELYYEHGGKLIELDEGFSGGKIGRWRNRYKKLKAFKKEQKITHTISFLEGANYLNILTKQKDKTIISIRGSKKHDLEISGWKGFVRKKILIPFLYPKAKFIVPVTHTLAIELNKNFGISKEKQRAIPNFYDINEIKQKANDALPSSFKKLFSEKKTIISSGRLHPQKAFDDLLVVFSEVVKSIKAQLIILGEGKLHKTLIEQVKSLELSYFHYKQEPKYLTTGLDVYFLGHQHNPFNLIKRADIFVLMSKYEGFPNALAEAMIIGTPVLSTDCPTGPRKLICPDHEPGFCTKNVIESKYGYLVPLMNSNKQNVTSIAQSIVASLKNEKKATQKAKMAQERMNAYVEDRVIKKWLELIESTS